jgi:hypothetical protein
MIDYIERSERRMYCSWKCASEMTTILDRTDRMYSRCDMSKMDAAASERHAMHLTPNRVPTSRLWGKTSTRSSRGWSCVARPSPSYYRDARK